MRVDRGGPIDLVARIFDMRARSMAEEGELRSSKGFERR